LPDVTALPGPDRFGSDLHNDDELRHGNGSDADASGSQRSGRLDTHYQSDRLEGGAQVSGT
jgi:hypothetical protein